MTNDNQLPEVRRVDLHVLYADGSSAVHTVKGHCNVKTVKDRPEIQRYADLRSMQVDSVQLIVDGIEPDDYEGTTYLSPGRVKLQAAINATKAKLEDVAALRARNIASLPPKAEFEGKFKLGDYLRMPAKFNPMVVNRSKLDQVWKVIEVGDLGVRIVAENRDQDARVSIAQGYEAWNTSTKVDGWDLRRGDFVRLKESLMGTIYKITGPAKAGDAIRGLKGRTTIALQASRGPAVWLIEANGREGWAYTFSLERVEVEVTKKADIWTVAE